MIDPRRPLSYAASYALSVSSLPSPRPCFRPGSWLRFGPAAEVGALSFPRMDAKPDQGLSQRDLL